MKSLFQILIFVPLALHAQTSDWEIVSSAYSSQQTVEILQKAIQEKGLKLFTIINHAQEAESANLNLRPLTVLIFGNPKAGTVLMNCDPQIGIDLPLKILVWGDSNGQIKAGFINPEKFLKEYNLENCKEVLPKMKSVLQELLATVAKKN